MEGRGQCLCSRSTSILSTPENDGDVGQQSRARVGCELNGNQSKLFCAKQGADVKLTKIGQAADLIRSSSAAAAATLLLSDQLNNPQLDGRKVCSALNGQFAGRFSNIRVSWEWTTRRRMF